MDRIQRNFEPMRKQVEVWRQSELTDVTAKMIIYQAFIAEIDQPGTKPVLTTGEGVEGPVDRPG